MACVKPLKAYRGPNGKITFKMKEGWHDLPSVNVACRRCISCRLAKSKEWALRAMHEAQMHERNCFITLTYNDSNLPKDMGLDVKHWQLFAKRLREKCGPFRFIHCGEYGSEENTLRPHFHALIFGLDFHEDKTPWSIEKGHTLYRSKTLESVWTKGFSTIGPVTYESANYVARYTLKKVTGDLAHEHYSRVNEKTGETWEVKPEYITMSRRPGLGAKWYEKFKDDVHPSDFCIANGKKQKPPGYYDLLLERENPKLLETLKKKRREFAKTHSSQSPKRLEASEANLRARLGQMKDRQ